MIKPQSLIHVIVSRRTGDPTLVRWYVRHVWWSANRKGAFDRVVASGEFTADVGVPSGGVAILALQLALGELERERDERGVTGT